MAVRQEQERASDEVSEIAPGVLRMQLPVWIPGLGHVNCYALADDRGAALVDPGLPGTGTWDALVGRLSQAGLTVECCQRSTGKSCLKLFTAGAPI